MKNKQEKIRYYNDEFGSGHYASPPFFHIAKLRASGCTMSIAVLPLRRSLQKTL